MESNNSFERQKKGITECNNNKPCEIQRVRLRITKVLEHIKSELNNNMELFRI